jgi:molybdate transport system substrate-binding protein
VLENIQLQFFWVQRENPPLIALLRGDITSSMVKRILVAASLLMGAVAHGGTVTVSAAISLKDALSDISAAYEKQGGDHIEFAYGASGQLAAQIQQGAPVDLFISAAWTQVNQLSKAGLVDDASKKVVAKNALVLIVPANATASPASFKDLANEQYKKIAIGDPRTVPAGDYAKQTLMSSKIFDTVQSRLIFGANVRQVLSYVERGEVDAGIVYKTDALQSGEKVKTVAAADESLHKPIEYPAVVIKNAADHDGAQKFLDYLSSEAARQVFIARGFEPAK